MTSKEMLEEIQLTADCEHLNILLEERKKLVKVAKWAGHLQADMIDEPPTHYNSWFGLKDALKELEMEYIGNGNK